MKLADLIHKLLSPETDIIMPSNTEVFVECPETCGSWSIDDVKLIDNKLVITIDSLIGPNVDE
jgi:hypothetical protein